MLSDYINSNLNPISTTCGCELCLPINEDSGNFIDKKTYDLKKRYDELNEKHFNNSLPSIKLKFGKLRKGVSGLCTAMVTRLRGANVYNTVRDIEITLSSIHNFTERTLTQILVHEMIHAHFYNIKSTESHGHQFKAMASRISKTIGFEIPITDSITELDEVYLKTIKPHGIIVFNLGNNHDYKVLFTSEKSFEKLSAELFYSTLTKYRLPKDTKVTFGIGKSFLFAKYPSVRSVKKLKWFPFTFEDFNNIEWVSAEEKYIEEL